MAIQKESDLSNESLNLICVGTVLKGDISANGKTRIDGELVGNIKMEEKLVIGLKGRIEGEIYCQTIEIEGSVKGNIIARELLVLKATSNVEGDITAGKLMVEPGAILTGKCKIGVVHHEADLNIKSKSKQTDSNNKLNPK